MVEMFLKKLLHIDDSDDAARAVLECPRAHDRKRKLIDAAIAYGLFLIEAAVVFRKDTHRAPGRVLESDTFATRDRDRLRFEAFVGELHDVHIAAFLEHTNRLDNFDRCRRRSRNGAGLFGREILVRHENRGV